MQTLLQDIRFGARMLLKKPGFTLIAVITLALGIGANTAIFSVVNSVLLRPLPYEAPDRLVYVYDSNPTAGFPRFSSSPPNFADWRRQQQSFEYLAAFLGWNFNFTGRGEPERLLGAMSDLMKPFCSSGRGPKYQTSASRATGWRSSRANSLRLNHVVDRCLERKAERRPRGIGKQSSSRQMPCGLITNPVARFRSASVTHRSSAESVVGGGATSVVRLS